MWVDNTDKKEKSTSLVFTPKEEKLYELLTKYDETGQLPKMLEGVVKVLNDVGNPMRFSQAANTIRSITDTILNSNKSKINKPVSYISEEKIKKFKGYFKTILKISLEKIADEEDKEETSKQAFKKYDQLLNLVSYGARTKKHQILELIGPTKDLRVLPKTLQKNAERLAKIYNYFTDALHSHRDEEPEFNTNWLLYQDLLILITSGFFDVANEIDHFLEEETIFGEGLK
jgi:hypothetical protein